MAQRMGAKTSEIKASHVPFISHPNEVAQLIQEAASAAAKYADSPLTVAGKQIFDEAQSPTDGPPEHTVSKLGGDRMVQCWRAGRPPHSCFRAIHSGVLTRGDSAERCSNKPVQPTRPCGPRTASYQQAYFQN
jgi:hypothetical protein